MHLFHHADLINLLIVAMLPKNLVASFDPMLPKVSTESDNVKNKYTNKLTDDKSWDI